MEYRIEDNVPIPENRGRPIKYPLGRLKRKQSFLVPCERLARRTIQLRITAVATKHRPKKFRTAQVESGVRVWRIA